MKSYFSIEDNYKTKNVKRSFIDKLFLGTRFPFYMGLYKIFKWCASHIDKNGDLDFETYSEAAIKCIRLAEQCGAEFHIEGLDNLANLEQAPVIIGNHMSLLETISIGAMTSNRRKATFVIKKDLLKVKFFGKILKGLQAIPILRKNPKEDFKIILKSGCELLNKGISVIIFPQSTRSAEFIPEQFSSIGIKLAKKANAPIIPLALKTDFIENGKYLRNLGPLNRSKKIYFKFGKPINVLGNGKEQHKYIIDFIQKSLKEWNK